MFKIHTRSNNTEEYIHFAGTSLLSSIRSFDTMEGMKDYEKVRADGSASQEQHDPDDARRVLEEPSLFLSDDVVNKNKTLGTEEESGVMSFDHDSLIQHDDHTEKLDQDDGSSLVLDSIVSEEEEDKKMSSFPVKKHLIAGRSTAARKHNNDNDTPSLLDQKRFIAGRSKAASNKNEATRNNDDNSGGGTLLDTKHAMAGRRAVATNNRNADSTTLLEEKHFIAARSQAIKTNNVGRNTMPTNNATNNDTSTTFEDPKLLMHTTFPGAVAVKLSMYSDAMAMQQPGSGLPVVLSNNNVPATEAAALPNDEEEGAAGEHTVNATLVEEKANQQKRRKAMVGSFCLASIIAAGSAIVYVKTRPGLLLPPSLSPTMSAVPSGKPSSIPSASPSTDLFGFLAVNSFDDGDALTKTDTPQYQAWKWLAENQLEINFLTDVNYGLLQIYSLVTMFYATFGSRWNSTVSFDVIRRTNGDVDASRLVGEWLNLDSYINVNGSCSWRGVYCNEQGEITSLQMSNDRLLGSLPAELAFLHPSLSKCYLICGEKQQDGKLNRCFCLLLVFFLQHTLISATIPLLVTYQQAWPL
jgi:hypothetical protein